MHTNNQPTQDTNDPHQKADFKATWRKMMLEDIRERNTLEKWSRENSHTCPFAVTYALHVRLKQLEERSAEWLQYLEGLAGNW